MTVSENFVVLNHKGSREKMRIRDGDLTRIVQKIKGTKPNLRIFMIPESCEYHHLLKLFGKNENVTIQQPSDTIIPAIDIIKRSKAVITPDTAIVHIACSFSKPIVSIYANSPELFAQWRPINSSFTRVIFSKDEKSLEGYESEELLTAVEELLSSI